AARALEIMSGVSKLVPADPEPVSRFKIGIPQGWVQSLDSETKWTWDRVKAPFPEVPFPNRLMLTAIFQPILFGEAATYHREWMRDHSDQYGPDVLESLRRGLNMSAVYYVEAIRQIG